MELARLVAASEAVAGTAKRREKVEVLAGLLSEVPAAELPVAVAYLSGDLPGGRIGVGYATVAALVPGPAGPSLTIGDVDAALGEVAASAGTGSQAAKVAILEAMMGRASERERTFLRRLLVGELRQGALEGLMIDAVARAAGVPVAEVRRAHMRSGDLPSVAVAARRGDVAPLQAIELAVLRPVKPMLAKTAPDPATALDRLGTAVLEYKLDGARIQVHRVGEAVGVFTRALNDVTANVPEIAAAVRLLPVRSVVLDGEAIVLGDDGRPAPFQVTMSRFGRQQDVATGGADPSLSAFFFDILHLDGRDLTTAPARDRFAALQSAVPAGMLVPRITTGDAAEADVFLAAALAAGHEGIVAKAIDAPYEAGRRGTGWLKVKPAHTLDLVVLAVEWGSGRRQGWLSNVHLGARDPATGGWVMLGKTFKGMTDTMLAWQTARFLELETHREGHVVYVRPEQVVEVAFDGIQASPRYPGGMALRFARVRGYRTDKGPDEADTIDTVRALFAGGRLAGTRMLDL